MNQKRSDYGNIRRKSLILRGFISFWILTLVWHLSARERFVEDSAKFVKRASAANHLIPVRFPSNPIKFQATAYCDAGITKSGVPVAPGIAAADLSVLPMGSLIHVEGATHWGIYRIMDTGRLVKGKIIDIYVPTFDAAVNFGRQEVRVRVLRYGQAKQKLLGFSD